MTVTKLFGGVGRERIVKLLKGTHMKLQSEKVFVFSLFAVMNGVMFISMESDSSITSSIFT